MPVVKVFRTFKEHIHSRRLSMQQKCKSLLKDRRILELLKNSYSVRQRIALIYFTLNIRSLQE